MALWPAPQCPFCAHHHKRRRGIFVKASPFLCNHNRVGPLPLPNGDSIEPLAPSVVMPRDSTSKIKLQASGASDPKSLQSQNPLSLNALPIVHGRRLTQRDRDNVITSCAGMADKLSVILLRWQNHYGVISFAMAARQSLARRFV